MNLEHLLTEDHLHIRETVRDFTRKEIIPRTKQLDDDYKLVEEVHQKLVDIGIQAGGYPAEYGGGGGLSHVTQCIICEELAEGDAGISQVVLINAGMMVQPAVMSKNKAVLDRFCPPFCGGKLAYACISMTDEAGGCDTENPRGQVLADQRRDIRYLPDGLQHRFESRRRWHRPDIRAPGCQGALLR
jgi:glutaryl-CoA dehydrogenase